MALTATDTTTLMGTIDMSNASTVLYKAASIAGSDLVVTPVHVYVVDFNLKITEAPAVSEVPVVQAMGTGTIEFFYAALYDSGTNTDIDFDLNINGSTALSGVVNVVHGTGDRTRLAGTLSTTALVLNDYVTVSLEDIVSSTGALGPIATVGITWTATPA